MHRVKNSALFVTAALLFGGVNLVTFILWLSQWLSRGSWNSLAMVLWGGTSAFFLGTWVAIEVDGRRRKRAERDGHASPSQARGA